MGRTLLSVMAFVASLASMAMISTAVWEGCINNHLYNCTDPGFLDFLSPGDWVHNPVQVNRVVVGRSMSDPDTIKKGWTITGLWCLWFSFVGVSAVLSALVALAPWLREGRGATRPSNV